MRLRMTQVVLAGEGDGRISSVGYVSLPAPLRWPLAAEAIVNDAKSADSKRRSSPAEVRGGVLHKIHMNFWCPILVRYCTVSLRESDIYVSMVKIWRREQKDV